MDAFAEELFVFRFVSFTLQGLPMNSFSSFGPNPHVNGEIELHNLCVRLANGHFQFQAVACRKDEMRMN